MGSSIYFENKNEAILDLVDVSKVSKVSSKLVYAMAHVAQLLSVLYVVQRAFTAVSL